MRYAPPPPRRRDPSSTPDQLRRLVHTEEARQRAVERPFDPEAPREHYARKHHFSVNGRWNRYKVRVDEANDGYWHLVKMKDDFPSEDEARKWADSVESHGGERRRVIVDAYTPNAFAKSQVDEHAATELVMFIENTADLSPDGPRGQGRSVLLNALRKWRKGTYDPTMAVRLFEYLTESGAKRYAHEFDHASRWSEMFNVATRREAARQLEESFHASAERGEYDDVDTRIGQ